MSPPPRWGLDGALAVACVVGLVVDDAVLCLVEQCGGFIGQSIVELCQCHFDFGVLALWGLWGFVYAWGHDGVLILLSRYLLKTHRTGKVTKLENDKMPQLSYVKGSCFWCLLQLVDVSWWQNILFTPWWMHAVLKAPTLHVNELSQTNKKMLLLYVMPFSHCKSEQHFFLHACMLTNVTAFTLGEVILCIFLITFLWV